MKGYVRYADVQDRITSLISIEPEELYIVTEHNNFDQIEDGIGIVYVPPDGSSVVLMTLDQCKNLIVRVYVQHFDIVSYNEHQTVPHVTHLRHKVAGNDLWLVFRKVEIP